MENIRIEDLSYLNLILKVSSKLGFEERKKFMEFDKIQTIDYLLKEENVKKFEIEELELELLKMLKKEYDDLDITAKKFFRAVKNMFIWIMVLDGKSSDEIENFKRKYDSSSNKVKNCILLSLHESDIINTLLGIKKVIDEILDKEAK